MGLALKLASVLHVYLDQEYFPSVFYYILKIWRVEKQYLLSPLDSSDWTYVTGGTRYIQPSSVHGLYSMALNGVTLHRQTYYHD